MKSYLVHFKVDILRSCHLSGVQFDRYDLVNKLHLLILDLDRRKTIVEPAGKLFDSSLINCEIHLYASIFHFLPLSLSILFPRILTGFGDSNPNKWAKHREYFKQTDKKGNDPDPGRVSYFIFTTKSRFFKSRRRYM